MKSFILVFLIVILINAFEGKLDSSCGLSQAYHDKNTNSPIYVFNARKSNQNWLITVLNKKILENYKVDKFLFYTSKFI